MRSTDEKKILPIAVTVVVVLTLVLFVAYLVFVCVIPIGCREVCESNGIEVPCDPDEGGRRWTQGVVLARLL